MTTRPRLLISEEDLAEREGGRLTPTDLDALAEILLSGGFVVLPSDSCYALAAIPYRTATQHKINKILRRGPIPMSLAFPTPARAAQWIAPNPLAEQLLHWYCPGPITVVTRAAPHGIPAQFFHSGMGRTNRTLGVRVPDSAVELAVAAATPYPTTTVAICVPETGKPIRSFDAALAVVQEGLGDVEETAWAAVDGARFNTTRSTAVAITATGPRIIREGGIPGSEIRARAAAWTADHG